MQVGDSGSMCTQNTTSSCNLNYEKQSTYNLTVEVVDSGFPPLVALFDFIINVSDVNDKPSGTKISGKFKIEMEAFERLFTSNMIIYAFSH